MNYTRIALLAGAATAFLFMLVNVTASNDFVYAPESSWKEKRDVAQDVAVAAWRSQQPTSPAASAAMSRIPPQASSAAQSSAPGTASSAPADDAASSAPAAVAQSSSADAGADIPDWAEEWWKRFGDGGDRKKHGHD